MDKNTRRTPFSKWLAAIKFREIQRSGEYRLACLVYAADRYGYFHTLEAVLAGLISSGQPAWYPSVCRSFSKKAEFVRSYQKAMVCISLSIIRYLSSIAQSQAIGTAIN